MKLWIDQDLFTGDGLCEEIAPDVFVLLDDGLAYVKEGNKIFAASKGNPQGAQGAAESECRLWRFPPYGALGLRVRSGRHRQEVPTPPVASLPDAINHPCPRFRS